VSKAAALESGHKIGYQAQRAMWISRCSTSAHPKSMIPHEQRARRCMNRFAAWQDDINERRTKERLLTKALRFLMEGRNVLIDYYMSTSTAEIFLIFYAVLEVFEGGLEGMDGGIGLGGCFEKLRSWLAAAVRSIPYRSKVAEEMLLCDQCSDDDMHKALRTLLL
jgi:hypothetical protein